MCPGSFSPSWRSFPQQDSAPESTESVGRSTSIQVRAAAACAATQAWGPVGSARFKFRLVTSDLQFSRLLHGCALDPITRTIPEGHKNDPDCSRPSFRPIRGIGFGPRTQPWRSPLEDAGTQETTGESITLMKQDDLSWRGPSQARRQLPDFIPQVRYPAIQAGSLFAPGDFTWKHWWTSKQPGLLPLLHGFSDLTLDLATHFARQGRYEEVQSVRPMLVELTKVRGAAGGKLQHNARG